MFHHAAKAGNDTFTNYLIKKANESTDEITGEKTMNVYELLNSQDANNNAAIHHAAKNRQKGVVNVLLGAAKDNADTDGVSDEVSIDNHIH